MTNYTHITDIAKEVEPPDDGILTRTLFNDDNVKAVIFGFGQGEGLFHEDVLAREERVEHIRDIVLGGLWPAPRDVQVAVVDASVIANVTIGIEQEDFGRSLSFELIRDLVADVLAVERGRGREHLAHAGPAARPLVTDDDHISGHYGPVQDALQGFDPETPASWPWPLP